LALAQPESPKVEVEIEIEIEIEVVYAEPQRAIAKRFRLAPPATVADALEAAAAAVEFSGIDIAHTAVGVYGKPVSPERILRGGDRVEIYRALAADPKAARRARVKQARRGPTHAQQARLKR
jgi:putative ubiquitin-RnfH superfamily antitoxin RatB of RatAB toxin-antitoxin module